MHHHDDPDTRLIELLEKQKKELVVRVLKKHEEAQAEKIFADNLLANLTGLFFITTAEFKIIKANEEFCRALGVPRNRLDRLSLHSFVAAEALDSITALIAGGEFRNFETEFTTLNGEKISISMNGSSFNAEPGWIFYMFIARDISDVRKMMLRVSEAQEQLIHSERLASLGEMAAGIGHELTQPLNAVLLFARNCLKCLDEPEFNRPMLAENLEIIIDRVKKASSIIKSLKSFARKEEPIVYPVAINPILTTILKFLETQLKLSDIEVESRMAADLPPTLGHEVRLEQIFLNIIQNAVQSMGETDAPRLIIETFKTRNFDPESLLEKDYIVTTIEDNGMGIKPEIMGKIFDPFFTTREVGTGMGLGLSIVARIVRAYGGFIKVESTSGVGTRFLVYLPVDTKEESRSGTQ